MKSKKVIYVVQLYMHMKLLAATIRFRNFGDGNKPNSIFALN